MLCQLLQLWLKHKPQTSDLQGIILIHCLLASQITACIFCSTTYFAHAYLTCPAPRSGFTRGHITAGVGFDKFRQISCTNLASTLGTVAVDLPLLAYLPGAANCPLMKSTMVLWGHAQVTCLQQKQMTVLWVQAHTVPSGSRAKGVATSWPWQT